MPDSLTFHDVFNVSLLKKIQMREGEPCEPADHPFVAEETFLVDSILSHRGPKKKREYLVRWMGYEGEDSWIPKKVFVDSEMAAAYERQVDGDLDARVR